MIKATILPTATATTATSGGEINIKFTQYPDEMHATMSRQVAGDMYTTLGELLNIPPPDADRIRSLEDAVQVRNEEIAGLKDMAGRRDKSIAYLNGKVRRLIGKVDDRGITIAGLKDVAAERRKTIGDLHAEADRLRDLVDARETTNHDLSKRITQLIAERGDAKAAVEQSAFGQVQEKYLALDAKAAAHEKTINRLHGELADVYKAGEQYDERIKQLLAGAERLRGKLADAASTHLALDADFELRGRTVDRLIRERDAWERTADDRKEVIERLETELAIKRPGWQAAAELRAEIVQRARRVQDMASNLFADRLKIHREASEILLALDDENTRESEGTPPKDREEAAFPHAWNCTHCDIGCQFRSKLDVHVHLCPIGSTTDCKWVATECTPEDLPTEHAETAFMPPLLDKLSDLLGAVTELQAAHSALAHGVYEVVGTTRFLAEEIRHG